MSLYSLKPLKSITQSLYCSSRALAAICERGEQHRAPSRPPDALPNMGLRAFFKRFAATCSLVLALLAAFALAGCETAPPRSSSPAMEPRPAQAPRHMPLRPNPNRPEAVRNDPYTPNLPPVSQITDLQSTPVVPQTAPADLWDRIRRGYGIPDMKGPRVQKWEERYASNQEYLARMTDRSQRYIFYVVEELELRGMPTELALLPYIESAFNPQALSSAHAAGMWQFIPSTGHVYDLHQNILRDDRRDVVASTRAALDYLQKLHDQFGDWQLALASYNWGEMNVQRAVDRNRAMGLPTDYEHLTMPRETRNYYPKLQAVKNLISHPEQYSIALPQIDNHPFFDTVKITQDIDTSMAASLAQISIEDFKSLNPSLKKPIIFAAGTPQILLPWDNVAIFKANLDKQPPGTLSTWTLWVAPSNLSPALAASKFNMTESDLRSINSIPRGMQIKRGSTLLVRRQDTTPEAAPQQTVDNPKLALAPMGGSTILRRVKVHAHSGETIAHLAARYDLPAGTVSDWNHIPIYSHLRGGQRITLYLPVRRFAHGGGHAHGRRHYRGASHRSGRGHGHRRRSRR